MEAALYSALTGGVSNAYNANAEKLQGGFIIPTLSPTMLDLHGRMLLSSPLFRILEAAD
jgi:hypothetical protein